MTSGFRGAVRALWRSVRGVLLAIAAALLFFEGWGWRPLTARAARLAQWPPLARLEVRIKALGPRQALALFLLPSLLLLPVKLLAVWFIALALPPGRSPGTNSPADCLCPGSLPHVPVRQWVLSLPIPLRLLLAAQPKLVTPVLQVEHRVITRHLLSLTGLKADEADSGAVTLIQRFGSAANLNIHLHCLVLSGPSLHG